MDGLLKSIIYSMVKLEEVGSYLASMRQKVEVACQGEAQVVLNAKAEIAELEKNIQAKIKDLKAKVNSRIQ